MSAIEATVNAAIETTPNADDPINDAALEQIFAETQPDDADEPETPTNTATGTAAEPTVADAANELRDQLNAPQQDAPTGGSIDLDALQDEPEPEAAPPAEDPYLKTVREFLPTPQALETVVSAYQTQQALSQAIRSNSIQSVMQALGPQAEPLLELFYQAAKEKLVERYINEAQGQTPNPEVNELKQQLAQVMNYLNSGVQRQQQTAQAESQKKAYDSLNKAIATDLEKATAKWPQDDYHKVQRQTIHKAIIADLATTGNLVKALNGEMKLVRAAVRENLTAIVEADKKRQTATLAARTQQKQTTKPIVGATSAPTGTPANDDDWAQQASDLIERLAKRGK